MRLRAWLREVNWWAVAAVVLFVLAAVAAVLSLVWLPLFAALAGVFALAGLGFVLWSLRF